MFMKEIKEKEGCVRDPDNIWHYRMPLEKCFHEVAYEQEKGRWICETCMTMFGKDPRKAILAGQ